MSGQLVPKRPGHNSVAQVVELLVESEKRLAAGPWDSWDGNVLEAWRAAARKELAAVLARAFPTEEYEPHVTLWDGLRALDLLVQVRRILEGGGTANEALSFLEREMMQI